MVLLYEYDTLGAFPESDLLGKGYCEKSNTLEVKFLWVLEIEGLIITISDLG